MGQVPPFDTYMHALPYPRIPVTLAYKSIAIPTHTRDISIQEHHQPSTVLTQLQASENKIKFYFPRKVEVGKQCDTNYDQLLTGSLPLWSNKQLVSLGWGSWRASPVQAEPLFPI